MLNGLLLPLKDAHDYNSVVNGFHKGYQKQMVYGITGSLNSYFIAGLSDGFKSVLVLTSSFQQAKKRFEDLKTFLPQQEVVLLPEAEPVYFEVMASSKEILSERLTVFNRVLFNSGTVVVAPVEAILKRLTPAQVYRGSYIEVKVGEKIPLEPLLYQLVELGYERVEMVEGPGHFSMRGGILDVFPLDVKVPYRIEFFDDEVDSIRQFQVETQRSVEKLEKIQISPAREIIINKNHLPKAIEQIKKEFLYQEKKLVKHGSKEAIDKLRQRVDYAVNQLEQGTFFDSVDQFTAYFYEDITMFTDYLPKNSLIVFEEPTRIKEVIEVRTRESAEKTVSLLEKGIILPSQGKVYVDGVQQLIKGLEEKKVISTSLLPREQVLLRPENIVNIAAKSISGYQGRVEILAEEIRNWRRNKYAIIILVTTEERAQKIREILKDYKIDSFFTRNPDRQIVPGNVIITQGAIESGFEYHQEKLVFLTDKEIFGQKKLPAKRFKETGEGLKISNLEDLSLGDFVVHTNHGIGKYLGIKELDIGGFKKDYLLIKYAGEDKLYVPTDQVNLIQKYRGSEGKAPKLSKLGGTDWAKAKSRVKESVQDMAEELLKLYAVREAQIGYSFAPDTVWQRDFEDAFPYEETLDQLRAIKEIKRGMENTKPMDRLLCGDVGYGKTEVAIRATFKAVMDGKQVAVLVPTTILAQQHYNTFLQRFAGFPVSIDMLSRFRTAKQQKETIEKLKQGRVDIIIGTHRLVQQDISFKDLGLVIVDEEQRFGVAHKEKLKTLKKNVDVLTLTATPIPRTLHMSMIGVRDISTLENPPEDRFPVQTFVMEFQSDIIRDAVEKEIDRGGQVYFVNNRISDIGKVAQELQKILPEARIAVGHGRMREEQLEKIILDFIAGEYDVLVCTTIIETGLDIPNVNTIIVNEADKFGLSQLYQLRGRVGRSHRAAYAYFTYRKEKILSEVAEKRLQAIREFTEFGSGFKIAMRDLEIRGAGNILGPEQHGYMITVGFEMYCRLLENSIKELKGEKVQERPEASIEISINAYINDDYITNQAQKIDAYKRIMAVTNVNDVYDVEEELEDRFGDIPAPVHNLLRIALIKALATKLSVETIKQSNGLIIFKFLPEHKLTGDILVKISEVYQDKINFTASECFEIRYKCGNLPPEEILSGVEKFLRQIEIAITL